MAGCQSFRDIENPLTKLVVGVGNLVSAEVDGSVGIKPVEDEVAGQVLGGLPAVGQILYVQHIGRGMLIVQSIDVTDICPVIKANPAKIEIVEPDQTVLIVTSVMLYSGILGLCHNIRITNNVRRVEVDVGV